MILTPKAIQRLDYQAPAFKVGSVELHIELDPEDTRVQSKLEIHPQARDGQPLVLNGAAQLLEHIAIDGISLRPEDYQRTDDFLDDPAAADAPFRA